MLLLLRNRGMGCPRDARLSKAGLTQRLAKTAKAAQVLECLRSLRETHLGWWLIAGTVRWEGAKGEGESVQGRNPTEIK